MKFSDYTIKSWEKVLKEFETSKEGLAEREAQRRLQIYGLNEVEIKEVRV